MLLKRYGSLEFLKDITLDNALKLFLKAIEKDYDDRLFEQWVIQLPIMSLQMVDYISFEDYKDKVTGKNIDLRSNEEIIAEIRALHSQNGDG